MIKRLFEEIQREECVIFSANLLIKRVVNYVEVEVCRDNKVRTPWRISMRFEESRLSVRFPRARLGCASASDSLNIWEERVGGLERAHDATVPKP